MTKQSPYTQRIREDLARHGRLGTSPFQVEAYMRLEHPTLDGLSARQFDAEIAIACECIDASTPAENAALARSYGFAEGR